MTFLVRLQADYVGPTEYDLDDLESKDKFFAILETVILHMEEFESTVITQVERVDPGDKEEALRDWQGVGE